MNASRTVALAALCLISGSGWIFQQLFPGQVGFPFAGLIHFFVIGCVAGAVWLATGRRRISLAISGKIALCGIGVFALPPIAFEVSSGSVAGFTSIALFCAIPLLTVLLLSAVSWSDVREPGSRALPASVLGLGGALLLFPVQLPRTARGWAFFAFVAACCAVVAFAGITMHRVIRTAPIAAAIALASFACAATLGTYGAASGWVSISMRSVGLECIRCLLFDLPVVWITVWLIREVHPLKLSSRFLLVPLLTAAEGYAAMGGAGVDLRAAVAMILTTGSAVVLVWDDAQGDENDTSTLHLR